VGGFALRVCHPWTLGGIQELLDLLESRPRRPFSSTFAPAPCGLAPLFCEAMNCAPRGAIQRRPSETAAPVLYKKGASGDAQGVGAICVLWRSVFFAHRRAGVLQGSGPSLCQGSSSVVRVTPHLLGGST